jgi:hypothetical protein
VSLLDALQAALGIEHEAVYGYGVVGGRGGGAARADALGCLTRHQILRDQLAHLVTTRGRVPVPAEPAYALPFAVDDPRTAAALAVRLEDATCGAAWDILAATTGSDRPTRSVAIAALTAAAEWSTRWRDRSGEPELPPFPGQPSASQPSTSQPSTMPTSSPS